MAKIPAKIDRTPVEPVGAGAFNVTREARSQEPVSRIYDKLDELVAYLEAEKQERLSAK